MSVSFTFWKLKRAEARSGCVQHYISKTWHTVGLNGWMNYHVDVCHIPSLFTGESHLQTYVCLCPFFSSMSCSWISAYQLRIYRRVWVLEQQWLIFWANYSSNLYILWLSKTEGFSWACFITLWVQCLRLPLAYKREYFMSVLDTPILLSFIKCIATLPLLYFQIPGIGDFSRKQQDRGHMLGTLDNVKWRVPAQSYLMLVMTWPNMTFNYYFNLLVLVFSSVKKGRLCQEHMPWEQPHSR